MNCYNIQNRAQIYKVAEKRETALLEVWPLTPFMSKISLPITGTLSNLIIQIPLTMRKKITFKQKKSTCLTRNESSQKINAA